MLYSFMTGVGLYNKSLILAMGFAEKTHFVLMGIWALYYEKFCIGNEAGCLSTADLILIHLAVGGPLLGRVACAPVSDVRARI